MKSFYSETKFTTAQNLPKSFHDAFICSWVLIAYLTTFSTFLSQWAFWKKYSESN